MTIKIQAEFPNATIRDIASAAVETGVLKDLSLTLLGHDTRRNPIDETISYVATITGPENNVKAFLSYVHGVRAGYSMALKDAQQAIKSLAIQV